MDEINLIILILAGLALASVFTSVVAFRAGAPLLLFFLIIGLLAGRDGPGGIAIKNPQDLFLLASAALAVILFDSGFHTPLSSYRQASAPAIGLAGIGVLITAMVVALAASLLLGFSWPHAILLGTCLSSTDAAALFFLLRVGGIAIRDRIRSTLEIESGVNDPIAASLLLTLVETMGRHLDGGWTWTDFAGTMALQAIFGIAFGLAGGGAIVAIARRVRLDAGIYPIMVLGLAIAIYAAANLSGGSGLLAAYLAGLVAGNAKLPGTGSLRRFQDGITWLAQIGMFVGLGLLARPSRFPSVALSGLELALILTFVARPLAVLICLAPFRFGLRERLFIAWVGLRGAVSILLALVPVLGHVDGSEGLFETIFLVVIVSLALQGWTVRPLARWLGLIVPGRSVLVDHQEVDLPGLADQALVTFEVHPASPVARGRPLPRWARPVLARKSNGQVQPAPRRLEAGDKVYLLVAPHQVGLLDKLFGRFKNEVEVDASLYGDFIMGPEVTLKSLRETYDLPPLGPDDRVRLGDFMRQTLRSDLEVGDRLRLGPIDLIVHDMEDGELRAIGLSLDPQAMPAMGWEKLKLRIGRRLRRRNE